MPNLKEHACRIRQPGKFEKDSFRRIKRDNLAIIIGHLKGEEDTTTQAFRYPTEDWTKAEAKAHCKEQDGTFEGATTKSVEGDMNETPDKDGTKAVDLELQLQKIREAWYAEHRPAQADDTKIDDRYIRGVFDEYVIVQAPEGLFQYPYQLTDDGPEFGEPTEVEVEYKPVVKAVTSDLTGYAVKAIREQDGGQVIGGYLLLWGGPKQRDLQGDYFTPETELWLDHYKTAPTLFHHGLDDTVGLAPIGRRVETKADDTGLWVEDWIDKSNRYWSIVEPLLNADRLFYSPGSAPHLIKRAKSGELLSFPVIEDTLTPMPAQYRLRPIEEIEATYKSANIELNLPDEDIGESGDSGLGTARLLAQAATILSEPIE